MSNASLVDTIVMPTAPNSSTKQVNLSVSCELMKNQQRALPIEPTRNMLVVQDSHGQPMIFTIGTDRHFHLLQYDEQVATGWRVTDLSTGFSQYAAATVFEISQDLQGQISVAVALEKANASTTDLFMASLLSNDTTDWSKFASLCTRVSGVDANFAAEKLLMGTSDDGNAPLLVASGAIQGQEYSYQVDGTSFAAQQFEFPENVSSNNLLDLSIGYAFGQRGFYFLYKIGETETLECTTLATPDEGSEHFDYSPGNPHIPPPFGNLVYNCIATPTGSQTDPFLISSDIYVGAASGIYLFRDARAESCQKVTDRIQDVHELLIADDQENISIWAMCSPNKLYYIAGKKGASYTWNDPVLFSTSIIHIAPTRNQAKKANELFVVNQDESITHYWQDPASTLWQQRTLKVPGENYTIDLNTFVTQINLQDEHGGMMPNQLLKVTASQWTYVEINGLIYSLDRDVPAEIATDGTGNLTLISMTSSISTPIFHVDADLFEKTLNIYPNGKIEKGLRALKTGDDLKNARTQDNRPVLTGSYDATTLNGIVSTLNTLTDSAANYVVGTRSSADTFVALEDKGVKHTGALNLAPAPDFTVGMRYVSGSWQPQTSTQLRAAASNASAATFLADVGDVWQWLENAFNDTVALFKQGIVYLKDGVSFLIQKAGNALTLVLNLADQVLHIALDNLGSVFKALDWVLKLIEVGLETVLAWLGHLFGWDVIWKTHKVIASIMTSGLDYAVARVQADIEQWRSEINQFLSKVSQDIKNLVIPPQFRNNSLNGGMNNERNQDPAINLSSPPSNWVFYQMLHGGLLEGPSSDMPTNDPLSQFINDVIIPTAQTIANDLEKDLADFERVLTDPSKKIEDLVKLVADLIDTVIDPVKKIIDGLLKFVEDLLGDARQALEGSVDIPFVGSLYSWITELLGDKEELTVINAIALLIAIPYTYLYERATGQEPFAHGTDGLDDPKLFYKLLGTPAAPRAASSEQVAVPTSTVRAQSASVGSNKLAASAGNSGNEALSTYSRVAGGIGAVLSVAAGISSFFVFGYQTQQPQNPGKLLLCQRLQLGFSIGKYLMTIPLPAPGQNNTAYALRWVGYGLGAVYTGASPFITKPQVRGGIVAGVDLVILALLLTADGIGSAEWWNWVSDSFSNVGGITQGAATVFVQEEFIILGMALSYLGGSLIGFLHACAANASEVVYLINVGG